MSSRSSNKTFDGNKQTSGGNGLSPLSTLHQSSSFGNKKSIHGARSTKNNGNGNGNGTGGLKNDVVDDKKSKGEVNENGNKNVARYNKWFDSDGEDDDKPINKLPKTAPKGRGAQTAKATTKKSKRKGEPKNDDDDDKKSKSSKKRKGEPKNDDDDDKKSKSSKKRKGMGELKNDDDYNTAEEKPKKKPKQALMKDQKKDDVGGGKLAPFIYDKSKEYGDRDEIGMVVPCCVHGCSNKKFRTFFDVQSDNSIVTRDFCFRHFRNHYDSLSAAQQVEHDNAKRRLMQELNNKMARINFPREQMLSGKLQQLCNDANLSIARFIPKSRGEGMALLDYKAVADIVDVPPEDMYKRLTRDYAAKPDEKMLYPKKPGAKRAPNRLPGAFDRPVVLYLKGFNATDPPPGLSREYLDKKNKKAREDRAEKTAAKKRKMDNEYDSDDDSD